MSQQKLRKELADLDSILGELQSDIDAFAAKTPTAIAAPTLPLPGKATTGDARLPNGTPQEGRPPRKPSIEGLLEKHRRPSQTARLPPPPAPRDGAPPALLEKPGAIPNTHVTTSEKRGDGMPASPATQLSQQIMETYQLLSNQPTPVVAQPRPTDGDLSDVTKQRLSQVASLPRRAAPHRPNSSSESILSQNPPLSARGEAPKPSLGGGSSLEKISEQPVSKLPLPPPRSRSHSPEIQLPSLDLGEATEEALQAYNEPALPEYVQFDEDEAEIDGNVEAGPSQDLPSSSMADSVLAAADSVAKAQALKPKPKAAQRRFSISQAVNGRNSVVLQFEPLENLYQDLLHLEQNLVSEEKVQVKRVEPKRPPPVPSAPLNRLAESDEEETPPAMSYEADESEEEASEPIPTQEDPLPKLPNKPKKVVQRPERQEPERAQPLTLEDRLIRANIRLACQNARQIHARVYIEGAGKYKTILVTSMMSARYIIDFLYQKNLIDNDPSWTLMEINNDAGIERPICDFEVPVDIMASWELQTSNALLVRKFNMREAISLECLKHPFPNMFGWVYLQQKKGKWQRRFLQLRKDILYHAKDNKHSDEQMLCPIRSFDVYTLFQTPKKSPTRHLFCLKSSDPPSYFEKEHDYIHFLAAENAEKMTNWILSISHAKIVETVRARRDARLLDASDSTTSAQGDTRGRRSQKTEHKVEQKQARPPKTNRQNDEEEEEEAEAARIVQRQALPSTKTKPLKPLVQAYQDPAVLKRNNTNPVMAQAPSVLPVKHNSYTAQPAPMRSSDPVMTHQPLRDEEDSVPLAAIKRNNSTSYTRPGGGPLVQFSSEEWKHKLPNFKPSLAAQGTRQCGICGCLVFESNAFKPDICKNCQHFHG